MKLTLVSPGGSAIDLEVAPGNDGVAVTRGTMRCSARVLARDGYLVCFELDGRIYRAYAQRDQETLRVVLRGREHLFRLRAAGAPSPDTASGNAEPILRAALPGRVQKILVQAGASIASGDVLMLIEAMKMENPVLAEANGVLAEVHVEEGEMVQVGQPLATCAYQPHEAP